jgi:hypothetical protein
MDRATMSRRVRVVFDIWGQRAETVFTEESELLPAQWCATVEAKGFAFPVLLIDDETGTVLVDEEKMKEIFDA